MAEQEAVAQEAVAQEGQQASPELTIVDLQNIRAIIDVAAKRGAFGAAEMGAVGGVFTKLDTFLAAAAPAATEAPTKESAPAAE